jgi:hypothetical protein
LNLLSLLLSFSSFRDGGVRGRRALDLIWIL